MTVTTSLLPAPSPSPLDPADIRGVLLPPAPVLQPSSHKTACSVSPHTLFRTSAPPWESHWLLVFHLTLNPNIQDPSGFGLLPTHISILTLSLYHICLSPINAMLVPSSAIPWMWDRPTPSTTGLHLPNPTHPQGPTLMSLFCQEVPTDFPELTFISPLPWQHLWISFSFSSDIIQWYTLLSSTLNCPSSMPI